MKRIQNTYQNTIIIQKSEFITQIFRVHSLEEVNTYLDQVKKKYYDATHNCYAYILGENQEIQKCFDDGEPQKTAGFPMIEVLKKNHLTDILVITTRYFGGILLGAGGLIRAYSSSVSECLKLATFYERKKQKEFQLILSYSGYNTLLKTIHYIHIIDTSFLTDVILIATCDKEDYKKLEKDLYTFKIDFTNLQERKDTFIEISVDTSI